MNPGIDVQTQVAVTLHRLATGNTLSTIGDLYGISENVASVIVRECCQAMVLHLKPMVIEPLTRERIISISQEFERLRGISYIIGAIDGNHIPIIAPSKDPVPYYCRKGFHSALLQGVVNA
jgi:hypothetical protein